MDKTIQALLYLLRCGLHGSVPEPVLELNYDELFRLSVFHSVGAMTAMVLESGGLLAEPYTDAEQAKRWKELRAKSVRKNILLDEERAQILRDLDARGIWYLPLKGSVLQALYPKMGMRQMADNDILFDETYRHQVKAYMESRGYKTDDFGKGNHDVYLKPPVYNFEFHVSLFDPYAAPEKAAHFKNLKQRLKKDSDNACGYHFSHEDFYVYILTHAYKHYAHSGTGIRILLDIYVFLNKYGAQMNWEYIGGELKKLAICDFEEKVKNVTQKLFGGETASELNREEQNFLSYLMGSGVYGTRENFVNENLKPLRESDGTLSVQGRLRYIWKRLFLDKMIMKQYYPFCRKHEWSIPFFWIYRFIKAVLFRGKWILTECRILNRTK